MIGKTNSVSVTGGLASVKAQEAGHGLASQVEASACAKAILVGEHSVLYGAAAVSLPVTSLRMQVVMNRRKEKERDHQILFGNRPVTGHVGEIVRDAVSLLNLDPCALRIEGMSSILIGSGMGSSAALSVVVLRGLAKMFHVVLPPGRLAELATELETRFHGKSSGLDTNTVAFEKALLYRKNAGPEILDIDVKPVFSLIYSGLQSSTYSMIRVAEPYFTDPRLGSVRISRFDHLAVQSFQALRGGYQQVLSEIMNETHSRLKETGVVNSLLQELAEKIAGLGVPAVKVTGAGGGGCLLALLREDCPKEQFGLLTRTFGQDRVFLV